MHNSVSTPPQSSAAAIDPAYTRLHITPLDPQLLKVIVPPAVQPNIRGLTYHAIQTFPDKPYGFLELPTTDAQRIKKKLNGAVLRGSKIRIEPARPVEMPTPSQDAVVQTFDAAEARGQPKKSKEKKKRKRDALEVSGVELEEGRMVKRGWTVAPEEAKSKKRRVKKDKEGSTDSNNKENKKRRDVKSLYTEGAECLVKTVLPLNRRDLAVNDDGKSKKKAKKGHHRGIVIHEFERNTKFATFLKSTNDTATKQAATNFVEGLGWVNEDGTVVEDVKTTRPTAFPKMQVQRSKSSLEPVLNKDTSSRNSDTSSEGESDSESDASSTQRLVSLAKHSRPVEKDSGILSDAAGSKSVSSVISLPLDTSPTTPSGKVHPLEALYRRSKKNETVTSQEANTCEPFTFGAIDDSEENSSPEESDGEADGGDQSPYKNQGAQPPLTPFTKQDLEWRNVRSAAPTPDTAHPSRVPRLWFPGGDDALGDLEEDNEEDDANIEDGSSGPRARDNKYPDKDLDNAPADFQKLFWERRAELNRSWKMRRRVSAKEKRYRENKTRADKAI